MKALLYDGWRSLRVSSEELTSAIEVSVSSSIGGIAGRISKFVVRIATSNSSYCQSAVSLYWAHGLALNRSVTMQLSSDSLTSPTGMCSFGCYTILKNPWHSSIGMCSLTVGCYAILMFCKNKNADRSLMFRPCNPLSVSHTANNSTQFGNTIRLLLSHYTTLIF
jgi:hypothetical protein